MFLPIIVDLWLVATILVFGYYGYKRGFIRSVAKLAKGILAFSFAYLLAPVFSEFIIEPLISGAVATQLKGYLFDNYSNINAEEISASLPNALKIAAVLFDVNISSAQTPAETVEIIAAQLSHPIARIISLPISFFCLYFIAKLFIKVAIGITDIIFKIPILGASNRILGCILCIVIGVVASWASAVIFDLIVSLPIFGDWALEWEGGPIYTFFNEFAPLKLLLML